jgi:hypothetical protein
LLQHLRLAVELLVLGERWAGRASRIQRRCVLVFFGAKWWLADLLFVFLLVEVLRDLDLHITQISLPRNALPLLLIRIRRLLRSRRSTFQAAVPVVRHEALALVPLGRAVRVYVVNVREVCLEPIMQSVFLLICKGRGLTRPRSESWCRRRQTASAAMLQDQVAPRPALDPETGQTRAHRLHHAPQAPYALAVHVAARLVLVVVVVVSGAAGVVVAGADSDVPVCLLTRAEEGLQRTADLRHVGS